MIEIISHLGLISQFGETIASNALSGFSVVWVGKNPP